MRRPPDSDLARESSLTWFALFASTGTLVCCALPIMLVTVGLGATVAAMTRQFPLLVTLSEYKLWVFAFSGAMLALSAWLMYRPGRRCPSDPRKARMCARMQRWNLRVLWVSAIIWGIGFIAAFLALPIRQLLDI